MQATQRLFSAGLRLPTDYHGGIVVSVERYNAFCEASGIIARGIDRKDG